MNPKILIAIPRNTPHHTDVARKLAHQYGKDVQFVNPDSGDNIRGHRFDIIFNAIYPRHEKEFRLLDILPHLLNPKGVMVDIAYG